MMDIVLLNTPTGKVPCASICEAEIKSVMCTENLRVKISNPEGDLFFDFDPNTEGFAMALARTRENMVEQKKSYGLFHSHVIS